MSQIKEEIQKQIDAQAENNWPADNTLMDLWFHRREAFKQGATFSYNLSAKELEEKDRRIKELEEVLQEMLTAHSHIGGIGRDQKKAARDKALRLIKQPLTNG